MTEAIIYLDSSSTLSLQSQIRQKLVDAILQGTYPAGTRLPSSRKLADQLGVARNTVVLAYEQLIDEAYLESRERSGIYVNEKILEGRIGFSGKPDSSSPPGDRWRHHIKTTLQLQEPFKWPADWQQHPHPFIDGYFDSSLYPTAQWREASRMALGARTIHEGTVTEGYADDPALIEEIRTKMLPRRGISASADEILITLGEQNALYLLTRLLTDPSSCVAMEEPGNPKFRELLKQSGATISAQAVDEFGMVINSELADAQLIYVTPSHQVPTAVTMPTQRRVALLKQAEQNDQLIIEDDIEHENNYLGQPHPALRGMDTNDRVIYVSGLPKVLAPGLRIGFIVAAPDLIREARKLRQMMTGRPSIVNQRTAAFFLSMGHYDSFMMRLHKIMGERWEALRQALNHYHRGSEIEFPTQGGTALWVESPPHIPVDRLVNEAARRGILIEPDTHYYGGKRSSRNHYRMGVTSIPVEKIREGVNQLERLIREMKADSIEQLNPKDSGLLTGKQLKALLPGATIIYKTYYGAPCTIELSEDGKMTGVSGHANEDCDSGRWWVEEDYYCRKWNQWSYGEEGSYQVTLHDNQIRWWRPGGRLVDTAIIQTSNSKLA
ncbi:MAG: GntR family transcriptional regulator/MocR family aminotransferase [Lysobacterales bacterium]|jgi:GntR family transcriptional regulator/MocR family aminotransferase